jgi:hypothetical protein
MSLKNRCTIWCFSSPERIIVWLAGRRIGKSFTLAVLATETCIKTKGSIVKYLCPDAKQAKTNIIPIFNTILEDCPKSLRPEYLKNDGKFVFPNGSEIQIAGNDAGRAESLRGGNAHLCIVDEAGFCTDLGYNVRSIMLPTTAITRGKIILSTTPPKIPGHEFFDFMHKAREKGSFIKKTIFDNKILPPSEVQAIISAHGGIEDPEFRREYLCETTNALNDMIIPEFTEAAKLDCVKEWVRPPFFDYYEAADIGFKDFTVVLFAYYDFRSDKLVVEDELVLHKMLTSTLAEGIKQKERGLLFNIQTNEQLTPFLRVSDNNLIVINDLQKLHGLTFLPTSKDNKDAAINQVRMLVNGRKLVINPRCVTLIKHLENGTWKKSSTGKTRDFERSSDNGHFDAIDALIYLARNVLYSRNPYPRDYNMPSSETRFTYRETTKVNPEYEKLAKQFQPKKSFMEQPPVNNLNNRNFKPKKPGFR